MRSARQIERFRHGRDQNPVTAAAVVAIRRRVGQPRFPRERLRRHVIEPELRRGFGHARRTRVPRQTGNRTLHHRVAVGSGRGDHRAGVVEDEGSTVRADGLASQQRDERVVALGVCRRRRTRQVVVQPHADARRRFLMEPGRQPRRIIVRAPKRDDRRGADHHEHQRDERREDEDPDRQAFLHRVRVPGVSPRPASQIHSLLPIARSLTCPGISAQNHPNRLASGRATRKAPGARSQVTVNVKNSADEMFR